MDSVPDHGRRLELDDLQGLFQPKPYQGSLFLHYFYYFAKSYTDCNQLECFMLSVKTEAAGRDETTWGNRLSFSAVIVLPNHSSAVGFTGVKTWLPVKPQQSHGPVVASC